MEITEKAEAFLSQLGFTNFRVRMMNKKLAKVELCENQLKLFLENHEKINSELKKYYSKVLLDLEMRNEQ